jgi:hypothetical protein
MLFFDGKFSVSPEGRNNDGVVLKAFGGGQGWGIRTSSVEELVDTVYNIVMRDNDMSVAPPRQVEMDIKAGIAETLIAGGTLTYAWTG